MRVLLTAIVVGGLLAAPARAEQPQSPGELLGDAGQKLMQALKLLLLAIPQYAAPEMNENGDIIIRRIHPEDTPAPTPPPEPAPAKPIQTTT